MATSPAWAAWRETDRGPGDAAGTIEAMAAMASQTNSVVYVVVPRQAGVVHLARMAATRAGVDLAVEARTHTVCARFSPRA